MEKLNMSKIVFFKLNLILILLRNLLYYYIRQKYLQNIIFKTLKELVLEQRLYKIILSVYIKQNQLKLKLNIMGSSRIYQDPKKINIY